MSRHNYEQERPGKQRRLQGIRSALAILKLEAGCVVCGYNEDPRALDFDHVTGTKVLSVSALATSGSLDRALDEVDKCEVVCANHHRIRTADREGPPSLLQEGGPPEPALD